MNKLQQCLALVLASCISTTVFAEDLIVFVNGTFFPATITGNYDGVVQDFVVNSRERGTVAVVSIPTVVPTSLSVEVDGKYIDLFDSLKAALRKMKSIIKTPKKVLIVLNKDESIVVKGE